MFYDRPAAIPPRSTSSRQSAHTNPAIPPTSRCRWSG